MPMNQCIKNGMATFLAWIILLLGTNSLAYSETPTSAEEIEIEEKCELEERTESNKNTHKLSGPDNDDYPTVTHSKISESTTLMSTRDICLQSASQIQSSRTTPFYLLYCNLKIPPC